MTHSKEELRELVGDKLDTIAKHVNAALRGEELQKIEHVLKRVGRDGRLPHWFETLRDQGTLPNLDGKTIGSIIEMLFVGVLETLDFDGVIFPEQQINPARGVDLPNLDLGVKSPSENYCTSEPFFSAYERLLGSEYDIVVLLTDYQTAKKNPPLALQIIKWRYLRKTQIADESLCALARQHREWLLQTNEAWAKKVFRFLAYANQSDWRTRQLLKLVPVMRDDADVKRVLTECRTDFESKNKDAAEKDMPLIPESEWDALNHVLKLQPIHAGVVDAVDNWVISTLKDAGRAPNENEWQRLKSGPLDGMIGMSFALQWRYNFSRLFNEDKECNDEDIGDDSVVSLD